jgi:uncharacterized low-complexity protein
MPPVVHSFPSSCLLAGAAGWPGKKKERKKENGQVATKQQASASSVNCGDWRDVEGSCLSVPTASHAQSHEVLAGEGSCVRARRLVHRRRERNRRRRNEEPFFRPPHMGCLLLLATHQESHHERERERESKDVMLRVGAVLRRLQQRVNCVLFLPKEEHGLWQASTADSCRDSRPHVQTASDD